VVEDPAYRLLNLSDVLVGQPAQFERDVIQDPLNKQASHFDKRLNDVRPIAIDRHQITESGVDGCASACLELFEVENGSTSSNGEPG
jgi:hypothetical protein